MYHQLIKPAFADVKTFILDTLFPIRCIICEDEGQFVCAKCLPTLKKLDHQHCIVCEKQSPMGLTHQGCATTSTADGLISALDYHDKNVSKILIAGKYHFLPGVFNELGKFLANEIKSNYQLLSTNYYLVPLPLHKQRLRWRGFNQAEILCQAIGTELKIQHTSVLVRQYKTKIQKDLKREQRIKNVNGAFALPPFADVDQKNIILVDDVVTTGSTLLEAAKVLKQNGAGKVWCLTVARD